VEKSVLHLYMPPQIHNRSSCAIMHLQIVCVTDAYDHALLFHLFPVPYLFCCSADYLLSICISLCNLSPNGKCVSYYVSVCCFEVTVWNRDDSDIRVLAWCCAQKLFFYLIITDHNTMRVFCIFYCLSHVKLLVCMSSRAIGRLLILPMT